MNVIVPLQTCSTRVHNKNLRDFVHGKSLFDIKSSQLLKAFDPKKVFISSESPSVEEKVKKYGFNFLLRDKAYTGNEVKQPDLIEHILKDIPDDQDDIGWAQVTTPMFDDFHKCLSTWDKVKSDYDSLVVVRKVNHVISEDNIPINFNFGYWHRVSQDLCKLYEVAWSFFIIKRQTFNECKYHIGYNPYKYVCNFLNVDIDTEEDFKESQRAYQGLIPCQNT